MDRSSALSGLQLFLVEDEPDTRELLVFVFEMEGAIVQTVETMSEALLALELLVPDVILSNVQLPDGDGYSLMREWRQREVAQKTPVIPAIAVTGADRAVNESQALAAGFQSFIQKPFDPDRLIEIVISVLQQHQCQEVFPNG